MRIPHDFLYFIPGILVFLFIIILFANLAELAKENSEREDFCNLFGGIYKEGYCLKVINDSIAKKEIDIINGTVYWVGDWE